MFITKGLSAFHLNILCSSSSSAGRPACMCVIVRSLCGLGYTHTECLSIGWKPAKQAAFNWLVLFPYLQGDLTHCWCGRGQQMQPGEELHSLTFTPQRMKKHQDHFLNLDRNGNKRGSCYGKLCLLQTWACFVQWTDTLLNNTTLK